MKKLFLCFCAALSTITGMCAAEVVYSIDFTFSGQGEWTIKNVDIGDINYVWYESSSYGMVASAYSGYAAHAAESWLISPEIDLTSVSNAWLELNQAVNKGEPTNLKVMASTDNGKTWSTIHIGMPVGDSWTFHKWEVNINKYAGQKIKLALVYKSTTSICPQWEIKTVTITGGNTYYSRFYDIDGIRFLHESAGEASVISVNPQIQGAVNIPATICDGSLSVTSIGREAFSDCKGLTSVTIPNSVTSIGSCAFYGCTGLTSVTIPESITSIGDHAFSDCIGLTSITIPEDVASIGNGTFSGCMRLTSVIWNAKRCGDFENGENAPFHGIASQITSFTFGNEVEHIPAYLCYEMSKLTSVTIPNSVTSIGKYAFKGTSWYKNQPNGVVYINDILYSYNGTMPDNTSIDVEGGTVSISEDAFVGCTGLTSITIPNSVTSIGEHAFLDCSGLTSITIPNSVTSIGDRAFSGCTGLTSVTIGNGVTTIENSTFSGCTGLTSVTIPDGVTSIGSSAFYGCSGLASVTIGNGVTGIGYSAFSGCTSLTSITIPESVTYIGRWTFEDTPWYNNQPDGGVYINNVLYKWKGEIYPSTVVIKAGTISISPSAFNVNPLGYDYYKNYGLRSIDIPNSVTSIGEYAFYGCINLTKTKFRGDVANWCNIAFESESSNPICYSHNLYINDIEVYDLVIPDSVTRIKDYAFDGWSSLTSITFETITPPSLGYGAFWDVPKIIPVYIPCGTIDAYKSHGWSYFPNLQEPPMPNYTISFETTGGVGSAQVEGHTQNLDCNVTAVMSATPELGCHFVQWGDGNTDNPRTVTLTQDTAFVAEFALDYSGKCGDNLYWEYQDNELRITGSGAMYDYTATTMPWLLLADTIYTVYTDNTATSIGEYAFANLGKLTKLHLGAGLENIGANAFAGCLRLGNIHCYAALPPLAEESSFANYNARLYVPCEVLGDYQLAIVFGNFKYIDCISSDGVDVPNNTVTVTPSTNDATFTWPSNNNANAYTLEITKDGVVFCTLTFNANGQLMGIAFAPSKDRNNAHAPQAAQATVNGWQFTVTGLNESSNYAYTLTVADNRGTELQTYNGTFRTLGTTALDNVSAADDVPVRKIFRNGQVLILRGNEVYTVLGEKVE